MLSEAMIPFQRSIWSTTDAADEKNYCTVWSGAAARAVKFKIEVQMDVEALGAMQLTPHAQVSDDGETWADVDLVGGPPLAVTTNTLQVLGPYEIDPSHGKRFARVCLMTEKASGTGLVVGSARGRLWLWNASSEMQRVTRAYKPSDTVKNNDATLAADPHLVVAVAADATYALEARLFFRSVAAADFNLRLSAPSGATHKWSADADNIGPTSSGTDEKSFATNDTDQTTLVTGVVYTGSIGGLAAVEWAQTTANASNTTLQRGSWLKLTRLDG